METVTLGDDSLRLQAEGFWNDAGVSSHTTRSVHAHERDLAASATHALHGTRNGAHGSVFTRCPRPPEPIYSSVVCVQKNYFSLLVERNKSGNVDSTLLKKERAFHPHGSSAGAFRRGGW